MWCERCGCAVSIDETLCVPCEDSVETSVLNCEGEDPDGLADHHIDALDRAGLRVAK